MNLEISPFARAIGMADESEHARSIETYPLSTIEALVFSLRCATKSAFATISILVVSNVTLRTLDNGTSDAESTI
jgi:hypothetical protein